MRKALFIIFIGGFLFLAACNSSPTRSDAPPSVTLSISGPPDTISNEVTLTVDASDDHSIDRVLFFVDGISVHSDESAPFEYRWQTLISADTMVHQIFARAYDDAGKSADSDTLERVVEPFMISLRSDVQPVFDSRCVSCHPGFFLEPDETHSNLVNAESYYYPPLKRVRPAKPDSSVLYLKIVGDEDVGDRMPLDQEPLSEYRVALIKYWILQGAGDN